MPSTLTRPSPRTSARDNLKRISVDQYHAMIRAGIFDEDDRIELLEGLLVEKMSKNPPHSVSTKLASLALDALLPPDWHTIVQDPVTTDDSEPEPDVGVVRGEPRDYIDRHPHPEEMGMVVEVADSTLRQDRGKKKTIYARANIPVYWIVNLVDRCIEVYSDPTGPIKKPDYRRKQIFGPRDSIAVVLDGQEIGRVKVKDLLP